MAITWFVPAVELSIDEDGVIGIMTVVTDPDTAAALVGKEFDVVIANIRDLEDEEDGNEE
jgi:hypothetical protein